MGTEFPVRGKSKYRLQKGQELKDQHALIVKIGSEDMLVEGSQPVKMNE